MDTGAYTVRSESRRSVASCGRLCEYELVINLKITKTLGLALPQPLLPRGGSSRNEMAERILSLPAMHCCQDGQG